jgi:UDP-4-amino-4,6-dideoxy-N-acetyl-beta-L-altrosamine transaminase
MQNIPYATQEINQADIQAVIEVLQADYLTQGKKVPEFEQAVSKVCRAEFAVAVNSGTSALHIACLALGVGPGDYVWTSPNSFVASSNCALYCGANIDFVDIDPRTYNLSVEELAKKLAIAQQKNCLPKVVIPVHFAGLPCDMQKIHTLANQYGFKIIEDASHALGASYAGKPVGCGCYADISVFSFHPVKIITTGEGGMALTNDADLAERMRLYRSHGITRDQEKMTQPAPGSWYYQQQLLGFNYRMTDIQAALGISQLSRLPEFISKRRAIAQRYMQALSELPLQLPMTEERSQSAWHLFVVQLVTHQLSKTRQQVFTELRTQGIGVNVHYQPIHLQPYYQHLGFSAGDFPVAEAYYNGALSLPMFTKLSEAQQAQVIASVREVVQ